MVNNAGIATIGDVEALTLDTWRKILAVNLDVVFVGTQAAIAHEKQGSAAILNNGNRERSYAVFTLYKAFRSATPFKALSLDTKNLNCCLTQ